MNSAQILKLFSPRHLRDLSTKLSQILDKCFFKISLPGDYCTMKLCQSIWYSNLNSFKIILDEIAESEELSVSSEWQHAAKNTFGKYGNISQ